MVRDADVRPDTAAAILLQQEIKSLKSKLIYKEIKLRKAQGNGVGAHRIKLYLKLSLLVALK